jgi:hypothetical protein
MEQQQKTDGLGATFTVVTWLINAAMFVVVGIAVAGFAFIIADVLLGTALALVVGLVAFLAAGYLAVKISDAIFGGLGRAVGKAIKNAGKN